MKTTNPKSGAGSIQEIDFSFISFRVHPTEISFEGKPYPRLQSSSLDIDMKIHVLGSNPKN